MAQELTGIERQLVLNYLMDGNVPVTVTPLKAHSSKGKVHTDSSRIFPVALRAEQLTVLNQGIILLKKTPQAVQSFNSKKVKVQFYFNKLGLYFVTTMKQVSSGMALVIPSAIYRIADIVPQAPSAFTAILYFESGEKTGGLHIDCRFDASYPLFVPPRWSDIDEKEQKSAKAYLEKAVSTSRSSGTALGNGLFLVPVCRYLAHIDNTIQAVADLALPPTVLFVNHERIVFGSTANAKYIQSQCEYALKLGFPLQTPVKERTIYITFVVEALYTSEDAQRTCAVCRYTSIKAEDVRFLYEMQEKKQAS